MIQSKIKLIDVENFINKMKKFIEHFRDEMLIAQIIYEINVNRSRRFCFKYFVENQMWLNVKNFNIARFVVKLNDRHVDFFFVKHVYEKKFLIVELKFFHFMKIHFVFHVALLSQMIIDSLLDQIQQLKKSIIVENDERVWYVNRIINFKLNRRYNFSLLKYYVDWKNHFFTWKLFNLINNCEQIIDEFHVSNLDVVDSHVIFCTISHC